MRIFTLHLLPEFNFFRLLPKNARHRDAKRHVKVVPAKLSRPQNNLRIKHVDCNFTMASVKHARELESLFLDKNVFFLSADDKARVPLGLPVSKEQTAILMHVEYRVKLPDHDFPISEKHKLIRSFYAACEKNKACSIGYNWPTYITIRSGKHDKSSATSHIEDFGALPSLDEFKEACLKDGALKPMLFVSVDGGQDEAAKSTMTLETWVPIFKEYDLDIALIFTHAPGWN